MPTISPHNALSALLRQSYDLMSVVPDASHVIIPHALKDHEIEFIHPIKYDVDQTRIELNRAVLAYPSVRYRPYAVDRRLVVLCLDDTTPQLVRAVRLLVESAMVPPLAMASLLNAARTYSADGLLHLRTTDDLRTLFQQVLGDSQYAGFKKLIDVKYAFVSKLIYHFAENQRKRITDIYQFFDRVTARPDYEAYHHFTIALICALYLGTYSMISATSRQAVCPFPHSEIGFASDMLLTIMNGDLSEYIAHFGLTHTTSGNVDALELYRSEVSSGVKLSAQAYPHHMPHYLPYQRFTRYVVGEKRFERLDADGNILAVIHDDPPNPNDLRPKIAARDRVMRLSSISKDGSREPLLVIKNGYCPELVWGGVMYVDPTS